MFNGTKVIDVDGHVMEPNELYDHYLEEKFKPDLDELKKSAANLPSKYLLRHLPSAQHRTAARRAASG